MEENLDSFDSETMLKLKKKGRLIGDVSKIFEQISRKMEVYKCCYA